MSVFLPDFLKKKTCEVQAFLKAIQLYRQDRGHYEPWDMLIGSDVRVRLLTPTTQNQTRTQNISVPIYERWRRSDLTDRLLTLLA